MDINVVTNMAYNMLILMSLAVVYSVFKNDSFFHPIVRKILMGVMLSVILTFVMLNSFVLDEVDTGIMFDTRAVILSISGVFFGGIPTIMGIITGAIIRIILGGVGAETGVLWIVVSGSMGLLYRQLRLKSETKNIFKITWIELYIFGVVVQIVMILLLFNLPSSVRMDTINAVAFTLVIVYPVGSLFISVFLLLLRKQYFDEQQTKLSETQYRKLFTESKANLLLIDAKTGDILDSNEQCIDTYGYSIEELTTMNITTITTLSNEDIFEALQYAKDDVKSFFQFKQIKKSGVIFDVEVYTNPVLIDGRECLYLTVIDISDKVQSQRMFKDADERLRTTLLSVGEGVIVTDEYARITLINDKAKELIKKEQDLLRKKVYEEFRIYNNQDHESFEEIFKECLELNKVFRSDSSFSLLTTDDEITYIDFTISPINNEHGINHGAILVIRDVSIEKERQEEVRFMSKHDYLTELYNRYFFETELTRLDTKRQLPLSIIIGDLNGLKLVNDSFGHLEGDKLLIAISDIFKKATRSEDIVARWGGDEFAILLPQTDEEGANSVINRINDLCRKSKYNKVPPSVSIGSATKVDESQDILDVLTSAEEEMYKRKMTEGSKERVDVLEHLFAETSKEIPYLESHISNMLELAEKYINKHQVSEDKASLLLDSIKYHDVGMISVDKDILLNQSKLSDYEWSRIKLHPETGSRLVATIPDLQHLSQVILQHHEHVDGSGYPRGLKKKEITETARILHIIDAYESMTNDRLYKKAISHDAAIDELNNHSDKQFDKNIVQKFVQIFEG